MTDWEIIEALRGALLSLAESQENGFLCWCNDGDEHIAASTDPAEHAVVCNRARDALKAADMAF